MTKAPFVQFFYPLTATQYDKYNDIFPAEKKDVAGVRKQKLINDVNDIMTKLDKVSTSNANGMQLIYNKFRHIF